VALLLISGRPGAGKTAFCRWLHSRRNYVHVETDLPNTLSGRLAVQNALEAQATKEYALNLGDDVVVEWGFPPRYLLSVRLLKYVGFDAWWFDADEATARELWRKARGGSPPMQPYLLQTQQIQEAWPRLNKFYGDHILRTVEPGPSYIGFDAIAARLITGQ
jgi:hypothetical protein